MKEIGRKQDIAAFRNIGRRIKAMEKQGKVDPEIKGKSDLPASSSSKRSRTP